MSIRDLVKKYQNQKRRSYPDIFHFRNWQIASLEEKMVALQQLEIEFAKKIGRAPRVVEKAVLLPNHSGMFNGQTIVINELEVQMSNKNVECVDTILHEGRHAYQKDCIDGIIRHDNGQELQHWRQNHVFYFPDFAGHRYYFQPIERDAFSFAHRETLSFFKPLEKMYGQDPFLKIYEENRNRAHKFHEMNAFQLDGPNYLQVIDSIIAAEYENEKNSRDWTEEEKTSTRPSIRPIKIPERRTKKEKHGREETTR